jgi:site-specific DNA recombinase
MTCVDEILGTGNVPRADRRLRFRLARYRAALDAGADPTVVQQWITEVQAEKAVAQAELRDRAGGRRVMTADEIKIIIDAIPGIAAVLGRADPADKSEVYRQPGLRLTYEPGPRMMKAEARPSGSRTKVCPRPDTRDIHTVIASATLTV